MNPIFLLKQTNFSKTIWWKLKIDISGYQNETGNQLITEILNGRKFRLVGSDIKRNEISLKSRILIQLFEDGYICWIDLVNLKFEKFNNAKEREIRFQEFYIQKKMPSILSWIFIQYQRANYYKWGGTIGPNFDCSGLIQTAFLQQNIFIPRDSYQMKHFCKHLFDFPEDVNMLQMGDLLFFGNKNHCDHVGIYFKNGLYYHSSGIDTGRNGIALDSLYSSDNNDVITNYYQSRLLSAGRVIRSYRWDKTLR